MDFLRRGAEQPQNVRSGAQHPVSAPGVAVEPAVRGKKSADLNAPKWVRVASVVLLFSLAILAVSIATLFYANQGREAKLVDTKKVQAVFLTNGQVYFGKVKAVNSQFVDLQDIYYLNSQTQTTTDDKDTTQPTSFSLVKLGCELHSPLDRMVINRSQVSFWENLSTTGKVAKGIDQWKAENPQGQKCTETSTGTQQSTGTDTTTQSTTNKQ